MSAILREPWPDLERERGAARFGMWVFLASEALFFGALILAYTANRVLHVQSFALAARETNIIYGTVNTAILLTSSLTMAVAAEAARANLRRLALGGLLLTLVLACAFLAVKGLEYAEDLREQLWPGAHFRLTDPPARIFFGFYWTMTAVHALHVSAGIGVIGWLAWRGWRRQSALCASPAPNAIALYWHLVDVIWIFLYPLLYLPGRA